MHELGLAALAAQVYAAAVFCVGALSGRRTGPTYRILCLGTLAILAGLPLFSFALRDVMSLAVPAAATVGPAVFADAVPAPGPVGVPAALAGKGPDILRLASFAILAACALGAILALRDWLSYAAWRSRALKASEASGFAGRVELRSWKGPAAACGFLRPIVFLPGDAPSEGARRAMEAHELAHARSGHFAWNALQSFLARIFWWNPFQGGLLRLGRIEREIEADAAAAGALGRIDYAEELLREAERRAPTRPVRNEPVLVGAWGSHLVERMRSLSRAASRRAGIGSRLLRLGLIALSLGMAIAGGKVSSPFASALHAEARIAVSLFPASNRAGRVSLGFGERMNPITKKLFFHEGIDIYAASGEAVGSFASGRVAAVGEDEASGIYVEVDHSGGFRSRYAHLSAAKVREGAAIEGGSVLGAAGSTGMSTGPHLHFALFKDGSAVDPSPFVLLER